jgi:RsiW-degrading membrane proteinase PrsW (M82 family)
VLLAGGAIRMGEIGVRFAGTYPVATLVAVVLFALFAVPFWLFLAELDFLEREPVKLRLVAFAWGGLVATAASIPGSAALENLVAKLGSPHLAADWGAALAAPTVEEIAKTLGIVAIVLIARAQVNSVLDGVVYGALVGLGFQIVENIVFAVGAVALAGQGDDVRPVVATFLLRGFLSGVWSHTLFGALAGAGIGYLVVRSDRRRRFRFGVAALCLAGAWAAHMLWNSPLLGDGLGNGAPALLAVLLLKGLPPLVLILWLVRRAHDREADYYTAKLADLRDPSLITEAELAGLRSGSRRSAARWHAGLRAGPRARSAVRRLQRAQARLAVDLSRGVPTGHCRAEILEQRAILVGLGHPEAVTGSWSWRRLASRVGSAALAVAVVWAALTALGGA